MNNIAQFREYVNRYGYFKCGRMMIEFEGKEYPVAGIWNLLNMGLLKFN